MHRCRNCLCITCMNTCCNHKNCIGRKTVCERYNSFKQLSIFDIPTQRRKKSIRDYTWQDYGISKKRYYELRDICRSGRYDSLMHCAAHTACPDIEGYIYLSVTKNLSYEGLQRLWELKEIEQMAYCRTDFYGYRRLFYSYLDKELRENNEQKKRDY